MCYTDNSYLLALFTEQASFFEESAEKINEEIEEGDFSLHASEATLIELLFNSERYDLDPVRLLRDVIPLVEFDNIEEELAFAAANYMKNRGIDPADSVHMAHCIREGHRFITGDMDIQEALKDISGAPRYIKSTIPKPTVI